MHFFDIVVGVILIGYVINGIRKGFFNEALGLVGTLGGIIAGILGTGMISRFIIGLMPNISKGLVQVIVFTTLFAAFYMLTRKFGGFLTEKTEAIKLSWLNNTFGGLMAGFKGAIILSLLLMYTSLLPLSQYLVPQPKDTVSYEPLYNLVPKLYQMIGSPDELPDAVRDFFNKKKSGSLKDALDDFRDDDEPLDRDGGGEGEDLR